MASVIKYEDYLKDVYPSNKILVTIFSQPFPLNAEKMEVLKKSLFKDEFGTESDIDAECLKCAFEKVYPDAVVKLKYNQKKQEVLDYIKGLGTGSPKASEFDIFFFVFLTYISFENTGNTSYRDERIHFFDDLCPMDEIYDELKKVSGMQMKPKLFLVQGDDINLLYPVQHIKGDVMIKPLKIPQDADRLVIVSDIPQRYANPDPKAEKKNPSFVIEAFCEALCENGEKQDLLSLTTTVNAKVRARINKLKNDNVERAKDMNVPLVTSTLTKLVKI